MKHFLNKNLLIIIFLFLLSFWLRHDHYAQYPQLGATHDEYAFAFLGLSLWQDHFPSAWSNIPVYKDKYYFRANSTIYTIARPYFDHPPLFGLLTGGWAIIRGEKEFEQIKLNTIRFLPLILGSISVGLLYYLTNSLYGFQTALISTLIYATVPTYVVASRMSLAENLLIPLSLLSLIFFEKLAREKKPAYAYYLGIIAGLAFLTKFIGIFIYLGVLLLVLSKPKLRKYAFPFTLTAFLVGSLYFIYGLALDPRLFTRILTFQGSRQVGPLSLLNIWTTPVIVNKVFVDGWVYFGWIAMAALFLNQKKNFPILLPFLIYLILFVLSVDQRDTHGWYTYPFFPFLAVASGRLINKMARKPSLLNVFFLLVVGLSVIYHSFFKIFGLSQSLFRVIIICSSLPFILNLFIMRTSKGWAKRIFLFYLGLILVLNIISVLIFIHPA